jgi:hypothetical protein
MPARLRRTLGLQLGLLDFLPLRFDLPLFRRPEGFLYRNIVRHRGGL